MARVEVVLHFRSYEVVRESDCRLMLVIEARTRSGALAFLSVLDPRDYEEE